MSYEDHLIKEETTLTEALEKLNFLGADATLFVCNSEKELFGSITDGDIRRGLLKGVPLSHSVSSCMNPEPKKLFSPNYSVKELKNLRENRYKIIPIVDGRNRITRLVNFERSYSMLPLDALVMAGGRGTRLSPMTDTIPKPLLKVGNKAIIDHNIDRLRSFGIDDFHISVRYLGKQLEDHYNNRSLIGTKVSLVWEEEALGTLGAASLIESFHHDYVLITNSDILTTLDYEDFFLDFLKKDADMAVATIPYQVDIPYAVIETKDHRVTSFKEKPTYTYYSNGGIYIVKRELLSRIPKNSFYNATDLMEQLIKDGGKLVSYPIRQYWLDIGKPEDFEKAQSDIKHLDL